MNKCYQLIYGDRQIIDLVLNFKIRIKMNLGSLKDVIAIQKL